MLKSKKMKIIGGLLATSAIIIATPLAVVSCSSSNSTNNSTKTTNNQPETSFVSVKDYTANTNNQIKSNYAVEYANWTKTFDNIQKNSEQYHNCIKNDINAWLQEYKTFINSKAKAKDNLNNYKLATNINISNLTITFNNNNTFNLSYSVEGDLTMTYAVPEETGETQSIQPTPTTYNSINGQFNCNYTFTDVSVSAILTQLPETNSSKTSSAVYFNGLYFSEGDAKCTGKITYTIQGNNQTTSSFKVKSSGTFNQIAFNPSANSITPVINVTWPKPNTKSLDQIVSSNKFSMNFKSIMINTYSSNN